MKLIADLERGLADREAAGLLRTRRTVGSPAGALVVVDGRPLANFASNDYLGLANHPDVVAAARDGASRWGVGAGASHLICGHTAAHDALEAELAAWAGPCAGAQALTFGSGYLANLAILTTLAGRGDAIFADRLNHACLNDGALLSRADFIRYPHRDAAKLREQLAASPARRKLIATDAVFSMDGDLAPLPELLALAEAFDAWLVVDDAHGFGVLGKGDDAGRGTLAHFGLAAQRIVYMGTLGKAAGVAGAFVAAHPAVIASLIQCARTYMFTTAAPPCSPRRSAQVWRSSAATARGMSTSRDSSRVFASGWGPCRGTSFLRRRRFSRCWSAPTPPRSHFPRRCGSAASGCPRSGRRPFRRAPRGCASR